MTRSILQLIVCSFIFFAGDVSSNEWSCRPISFEDISDAGYVSKRAYDGLSEGEIISGTSGYKVDLVVEANLYDEAGQPLKAVIASKGSTTILAYRGSDGVNQLLAQANHGMFKEKVPLPYHPGNMKVMQYPWEALQKLDLINKFTYDPNRKYIVTGHSLGGALATILSMQMYENQKWNSQSILITFASPRVGDFNFAERHDAIIPPYRKLRIVYSRDPVPKIPTGYRHISTEIWITKWCGWKLWWRCNDYQWHVCPIDDRYYCSNSIGLNLLLQDHFMYKYIGEIDKLKNNSNLRENLQNNQC